MAVSQMLAEAEKAFHAMDWEKLVEISEKILAEKPGKSAENLASGFYHYASAKLEKESDKIILDLVKACEFFDLADDYLAALAHTERLILFSEFDKKKRGQHLRELGELTQSLFIKTGDISNLQLAIESFNKSRSHFSGSDLEHIILSLQFCHGTHAQHSENPVEQYEAVIKLSEELKTDDKAIDACSNINVAIAHQCIASIGAEGADPLESIEKAIKLNEEAVEAFEQLGLKPETVKAKRGLANMLRDAAVIDKPNAEKYMAEAITLKKEVAKTLLDDGLDIESAFEDLDIGITYIEFATCDKDSSDKHFDSAVHHFKTAEGIFEEEGVRDGQGHAKAGIAAVHRNRNEFEEAAKMYEEAVAIFEERDTGFLGPTKMNLAAAYRDLAEATGKEEHLKKAEEIEKEAAELLKDSPLFS